MLSEVSETATKWAKALLEQMDPDDCIATLEEWVQWRARLLCCGLALAGYGRAQVMEGYRTRELAEELYGRGRTVEELVAAKVPETWARPEMAKVTWILPRFNLHWRRRAIDVELGMYKHLNDDVIVTVSRTVGMTWGGVWSVRDTYHFEV